MQESALEAGRELTGLSSDECYSDYTQALGESGADCVIICTPTIHHVPMAKQAMERGLPVLVEKGMAPNWDTACEAVNFARENKGVFCVSQNYRYNGLERTLHRLLHTPDDPASIGEPYQMDHIQHRARPEPRTLNYPFASVWDMSCHHFDNFLFWFGPIAEMTAHAFEAPWSKYPHPNNTSAILRFESGVMVNYFHGHDSARNSFYLGLHGKLGAVIAGRDAGGKQMLEFSKRPAEQFGSTDVCPVPFAEASNEAGVLADFFAYIDEGVEPGISGNNNLEVMALCQMMVISCEEARAVRRSDLAGGI
jgi:predicted dehydrogenase